VVSRLIKVMDNLEAVEAWRATLTEKQRVEWASPDTIIRRCPVFNPPPAADAKREPSAYAKLPMTISPANWMQPGRTSPSWRRHSRTGKPVRSRSQERQTRQHRRGDHRQRRPWPGREDRSCDSEGDQGQEPEAGGLTCGGEQSSPTAPTATMPFWPRDRAVTQCKLTAAIRP
jgi:hypothetical protein